MKLLAIAFWTVMWAMAGVAQQPPNLPDIGTMVKPAEPVEPVLPDFFPLAQVAEQAQNSDQEMEALQADAEGVKVETGVTAQLGKQAKEISARSAETSAILGASPGLDALQSQETVWAEMRRLLSTWQSELAARADLLERRDQRLAKLLDTWQKTLDEAKKAGAMPEVLKRIGAVMDQIQKARTAGQKASSGIVALQTKVSNEDARAREMQVAITQAQSRAMRMLLQPDAPMIWKPDALQRSADVMRMDAGEALPVQWSALGAYLLRQRGALVLHGLIVVAFFLLITWMRRHVGQWAVGDESLRGAAVVFGVPKSTALVLAVLVSGWIYPQPPRIFWAVVGGVALVPTLYVLHHLVAGSLRKLLYGLAGFYLCGVVLNLAAPWPVLSRFLFLGETLAGALFCLWFLRRATKPDDTSARLWSISLLAVRLAMTVFGVAFVMNALGYVGLARFLTAGLFKSTYLALVLNAAVSVVDALVGCFLHFRPVAKLRAVQRHRPMLRRRSSRLLRWLAGLWWATSTLDVLSLKRPVFEAIETTLTSNWILGSATLSIGGVVTFLLMVAGAFLLSKILRFVLEEDIYPRVRLARGVPYAISTILHYVILLVGFVLAVAALGYDMTKFTILAGAFGVGLGFGMQNIVNNFVSGLILLFERPVQVGDIIQLETITGVVTHIGIRASIVKVGDGSEVVVPNGKLIADRFTNWTLTDRKRRLEVAVTVAKDADPQRVIEVINGVAADHPLVVQAPAPQTCLTEFVAGGIKFELRVWTNRFEDARPLSSDLSVAVHKALTEQGIALL